MMGTSIYLNFLAPLKNALSFNIVLTFVLFVWGSVVRTHGAGLACPDWPLCHGKIIPPLEPLILLEWGHRLIAATVGFLTVGIGISVWMSTYWKREIGGISVLSVLLLIGQVILGAMTVKGVLHPIYVCAHVATAFLFFSSLLWMSLEIHRSHYTFHGNLKKNQNLILGLSGLVTVMVYAQIILGALVSSSHSGLACPDFPMCLGQWIPPLIGNVAIHYGHRLLAFSVLTVILILLFTSCRISWDNTFRESVVVLFLVALIQAGVGIGNIFFKLPIPLSILHMGLATLLFMLSFTMTYKVKHA